MPAVAAVGQLEQLVPLAQQDSGTLRTLLALLIVATLQPLFREIGELLAARLRRKRLAEQTPIERIESSSSSSGPRVVDQAIAPAVQIERIQ